MQLHWRASGEELLAMLRLQLALLEGWEGAEGCGEGGGGGGGGAESESEGAPSDSDDSAMEVRVNIKWVYCV